MIGILRSLDSHESSAMICDYNVCNNFDTEKSFAKLAQMVVVGCLFRTLATDLPPSKKKVE